MSAHKENDLKDTVGREREFAISVILQQLTTLTQKVYLSLEDLAAITTLSPGKLTEMLSAGELPQTRAGTRRLVSCYDLAVWIYDNHLHNYQSDKDDW